MNKRSIILFLVSMSFALYSCSLKEDNIFDQSPDERLSAVLEEYRDVLVSSPNGWLLSINTKVNGGFQLWMNFNEAGRVVMLSDMEATWKTEAATASVPKESSYRLKAQQMPTLIFDTYSYLHLLADPQGNINGGANGEGLKSDFEFSILSYDNGILTLRGYYNKCDAVLVPATEADAQAAAAGELKTVHKQLSDYFASYGAPVVEIGGTPIYCLIGARKSTFIFMEKGKINTLIADCCITLSGASKDQPASDIRFFGSSLLGQSLKMIRYQEGKYYLETDTGEYEVFDNGTLPIECQLGYRKQFTKLLFTNYVDFQGTMSEKYYTTIFKPAYDKQMNSGRTIVSLTNTFKEGNGGLPVMEISMVSRTNSSGALFTAIWQLPFTENGDGTITFTDRIEMNGNAENYGQNMRGLMDIFTTITYSRYIFSASGSTIVKDVVTPHTFNADWVVKNSPSLNSKLIGGLIRTDDPELFYCGELGN